MSSPSNYFPKQLLLNLEASVSQTFSSFIVGNNRPLIELMQSLHPFEQGYDHSIYCWAEEGCGKSHLLRAYCTYWQQEGIRPLYFDGDESLTDDLLDNQPSVLVFDNVHGFLGDYQREEVLLYLLRQAAERDVPLLLSADRPPGRLDYVIEDLATRLAAFYVFRVHHLDQDGVGQFISYQAKKLGLNLDIRLTMQLQNYSTDMKFLNQLLYRLAHSKQEISPQQLDREWHKLYH